MMDEPVPNPRSRLPVVVQPDPMLEAHGGTLRTIMMSLGAVVVVLLVFYAMTRPNAPEPMASAPTQAAQAPAASAGDAPAQQPESSTTGRGQRDEQPKSENSEGNAPRSDSSNDTGPKNQPQPQAQ
jgi:hypothetical protein